MVERGREAVDIGPRPLFGRGELFGCGVARGEDRRHRHRAADHGRARGAEVDQCRIAFAVEQDVGRLDVAVQEAGVVDLLETVEQRPDDQVQSSSIQGTLLLQARFERLAMEHLHDDVGRPVDLEKVEDLHDAGRTVQRGQRTAFRDEAIAAPGEILGDLGRARQHGVAVLADRERDRQVFLDRDFAVELDVARAIGDAEAALAEHRQHFVASDHLAGRQRDVVDLGVTRRRAGLHVHHCLRPSPRTGATQDGGCIAKMRGGRSRHKLTNERRSNLHATFKMRR